LADFERHGNYVSCAGTRLPADFVKAALRVRLKETGAFSASTEFNAWQKPYDHAAGAGM
jgi:hypothetical protein